MKKIYTCIKGSLKHLLHLMEGEITAIDLKEHLFESFGLSISSDQLTSELLGVGLKRSFPFHKPDLINPRTDKRTRFSEPTEELRHDLHPTSTNWSDPSIPLNPPALFPTSHANHISSLGSHQSGHGPRYHPQLPIPPIPLSPLSPFKPSHVEDHFRPFETFRPGCGRQNQPPPPIPQTGYRLQYQSEQLISPHFAYGSVNQWQPPIGPTPGSRLDYHFQPPVSPALDYRLHCQPQEAPFTPQSSSVIYHHQGPLLRHQPLSLSGHYPPDQNLQRPGNMDSGRANQWTGYSTQNLGRH